MNHSENLAIWEQVEKTDPRYTKSFTRSGGFSGTAINAEYIVKRLTELFGPIGHEETWGWKVLKEELVPGKPFLFHDQIMFEQIHHVEIMLWFYWKGRKHVIPSVYGNTVFVSMSNKGAITSDEEASAKSTTDALSKAAKHIGVSADIHLGLWDDNKYVADRHKEVGQQEAEALLGKYADHGREAFVAAYRALDDHAKNIVKPYLGVFEERVKKADARLKAGDDL